MSVRDFMSNYKKLEVIKEEIGVIVNKYEGAISYPPGVLIPGVEIGKNGVFQVEIRAYSIPFSVITSLNKYVGKDCKKITARDNIIALTWKF